ncbi:MAG: FAD-dependent oxidoreductase [Hyphomicrobiaceae bacterium]|nr:FAD-dependent oxidoreductase [Hyphomicrobiaceae bacterium]
MTEAVSRRHAIGMAGAAAAAALLPAPVIAKGAVPQVVVIGGGAGGATLARQLALGAPGKIFVTLIEPARSYRTCFLSNLMLAGLHGGLSVDHDYTRLVYELGILVVHDSAQSIDLAARKVKLASGQSVPYDRLVISPGIEFKFDAIEGYDAAAAELMPHAWRRDQPIEVLKARIDAMPEGGVFAIAAPAIPYRCPPGPYERASMVAHLLKRQNPRAKILIIDEKESFTKQQLFLDGWSRHYPGMIEWLPLKEHGGLKAVSAKSGELQCEVRNFRVDAANVIPPQRAGQIAAESGLSDASGWCPIEAQTMLSTVDRNVHVLGDSSRAESMPKSAESAASQARLAATAIMREMDNSEAPKDRIANTCWSLIGEDDGVKIGATFEPTGAKFTSTSNYISVVGEHPSVRRRTAGELLEWYQFVTSEMFGGAA